MLLSPLLGFFVRLTKNVIHFILVSCLVVKTLVSGDVTLIDSHAL